MIGRVGVVCGVDGGGWVEVNRIFGRLRGDVDDLG